MKKNWIVVARNLAICSDCGDGMALWKNNITGERKVICDYCQNEYTMGDRETDGTGLPTCKGCQFLDDIDRHHSNSQLDKVYCTQAAESFKRRMKPWHCPFSQMSKEYWGTQK